MERGFALSSWKRLTICLAEAVQLSLIHIYLAKNLKKGKQHLDDAESIDVEIYTLKELCDMIYGKIDIYFFVAKGNCCAK